jgi:hypothetical protein
LEKNSRVFSFAGVINVLWACMWYARHNSLQSQEQHKHGGPKEKEEI